MTGLSSPAAWDPEVYLKFSEARTRPAVDLISRITQRTPTRIIDLGCGTGNITQLLADRWPRSSVTGVDSSAEMLSQAQTKNGSIQWVRQDIAAWRPEQPVDLIVSNAALHWLDAHDTLFPRLMGCLNDGGELGVQMPRNFHAPSHQIITEIATNERWRDRLLGLVRPSPVSDPRFYLDTLSACSSSLDLWETTYWHILQGENPIVGWTMGTALRPIMEALEEDEGRDFLSAYAKRIADAYPPAANGKTVFPFRRLFMIARK